jgi:hypothetical protein
LYFQKKSEYDWQRMLFPLERILDHAMQRQISAAQFKNEVQRGQGEAITDPAPHEATTELQSAPLHR